MEPVVACLGSVEESNDSAGWLHLQVVGDASEFLDGWLERVWDRWTPDMRDLHPVVPATFPRAVHVPTASLPLEVRDEPWPEGWIERHPEAS